MSSFFTISHVSYNRIQRKIQGIIPIIGLAHSMLPEQYVHKPYKAGLWSGWELFTQLSYFSSENCANKPHSILVYAQTPELHIWGFS